MSNPGRTDSDRISRLEGMVQVILGITGVNFLATVGLILTLISLLQ